MVVWRRYGCSAGVLSCRARAVKGVTSGQIWSPSACPNPPAGSSITTHKASIMASRAAAAGLSRQQSSHSTAPQLPPPAMIEQLHTVAELSALADKDALFAQFQLHVGKLDALRLQAAAEKHSMEAALGAAAERLTQQELQQQVPALRAAAATTQGEQAVLSNQLAAALEASKRAQAAHAQALAAKTGLVEQLHEQVAQLSAASARQGHERDAQVARLAASLDQMRATCTAQAAEVQQHADARRALQGEAAGLRQQLGQQQRLAAKMETRRAALDEALQLELTEHAGDKARLAAASQAHRGIAARLEEQRASAQAAVVQLASELKAVRRCPDGLAAATVLDAQLVRQQDRCSMLAHVLGELQGQLLPFLAPTGPDSLAHHHAPTAQQVGLQPPQEAAAAGSALETLASAMGAARRRRDQQPAAPEHAGRPDHQQPWHSWQSPPHSSKGQQPGGVRKLRSAASAASPGGAAAVLTDLLGELQADASRLQQELVMSTHQLRQQCRTPPRKQAAGTESLRPSPGDHRRRVAMPHEEESDEECPSSCGVSDSGLQEAAAGSRCSPGEDWPRVRPAASQRRSGQRRGDDERSSAASLAAMAAATLRKLQLLSLEGM